jgi:hypothetical protein
MLVTFEIRGNTSSSSLATSFFGVNEEADPNPPIVEGADHALAPLLAPNPPKSGFEGVFSFDSEGVSVVVPVNEPKILVDLSETALMALVAASLTASRGVAASTSLGVAVALGDVDFSSAEGVAVAAGAVVSSTTGASLFTPDMMEE